MKQSISDKIIQALKETAKHNSSIMVKPEVILWPDPEKQWEPVISVLQKDFPALISFGSYDIGKKQGPAIWIKCMIAKLLPEANWSEDTTPIIYLPGLSKSDLKNISSAGLDLQPLMEYQYTGTLFTQTSGREWTVLSFMENEQVGLGLKVAQDKATREAIVKALPSLFQDSTIQYPAIIESDFLYSLLFPDAIQNILKWLCKGEEFLKTLDLGKREIFRKICISRFEFEPDYKNIKAIVEKFGSQRNAWKNVWQLYASSPKKYPELEDLLRLAKPLDMGFDLFAVNKDSWPQVNEEKESELRKSLLSLVKYQPKETLQKLIDLEKEHSERRQWVWAELGYAPLSMALPHLITMSEISTTAFPSATVDELREYYVTTGYKADQSMRKAFATVQTEKDKEAIRVLIGSIYKPWLESITQKFQTLIQKDPSVFSMQKVETSSEEFILFVDAFRFELAKEFIDRLTKQNYTIELRHAWSALPSLTPTAKPNVSPIVNVVNQNSKFVEFRPQLKSGKDLQVAAFREALDQIDYRYVTNASAITPGQKHWQEIGEIDTKGHEEQSSMLKRIEELFQQIQETIDLAFEKGMKRIKIVTDHGWLLLPVGLPKEELNKDLTETRWGRCASIKEGAKIDLLQLPWRWNPTIFIAYAPGISFFKKNEEYAHGGISIHECLVPILTIEKPNNNIVTARILDYKWVGLNCKITTVDAPDGYIVDIRTQYTNANSSIVLNKKEKKVFDNKISLMVDSDAESKSAIIVLMDEKERILDKKLILVGS